MEIKPVAIPVVKPVATGVVKPVAPISHAITPATAPPVINREASIAPASKQEQPAEQVPTKPSVTELSKEERLADVKNAVGKVEEKKSSKKADKKPKLSKNSDKKKEIQEGEIVRKEPVKKTINGIEIDYSQFKENEEEMKKKIFEHEGNVVFMDITTDEMRTLQELWDNGKSPYDRKLGEYVLSYDAFSDTLNKVFVDEIISITTETYYDDVRAANPTELGHYHVVYHRGRRVFDKINDRTFDHIVGLGVVKELYVVTIDRNTRCRFFNAPITKIDDELYTKTINQKIRESSRMTTIEFNDDVEGGE